MRCCTIQQNHISTYYVLYGACFFKPIHIYFYLSLFVCTSNKYIQTYIHIHMFVLRHFTIVSIVLVQQLHIGGGRMMKPNYSRQYRRYSAVLFLPLYQPPSPHYIRFICQFTNLIRRLVVLLWLRAMASQLISISKFWNFSNTRRKAHTKFWRAKFHIQQRTHRDENNRTKYARARIYLKFEMFSLTQKLVILCKHLQIKYCRNKDYRI